MTTKQDEEEIGAQLVDLEPRSVALQKQIQELKIRRNTYAPISKLPDDVLLEIFALIQTVYRKTEWYRGVTHVCRRWRYIAIEAPTLWTNPSLSHHHFAILMLERSKSADLTICMEYGTSHRTIEKVLHYTLRMEKLEIRLDVDSLNSTLNLMATSGQQAPRLRRFLLHCRSDEECWDSRPMFGLSTVFCKFHLLRELDISNIIFDWNLLPLSNLVSLSFDLIAFSTQVPMQKLLDALRQMPHLETLRIPISQYLFSLPSSTTETIPVAKVVLPRLSHLDVRDSHYDYLQSFLSNITAPQLHWLWVAPTVLDDYNEGSTSNIAQAVTSLVTGGDFGTFDRLALDARNFRLSMFASDWWDSDKDADSVDETPLVHFGVQTLYPDAVRLFAQTSVDILSHWGLNLSCLVDLKIDDLPITADELSRLSTALCSVRKIKISKSSTAALALIGVLAALPPHHPLEADELIPFPALNFLQFSALTNFATESPMLEALCDSLMLRCEYGVAISQLEISQCWFFPEQFALLKEIVVDVRYSTTYR